MCVELSPMPVRILSGISGLRIAERWFLDEIGELPLQLQPKLLVAAVEMSHEIQPVEVPAAFLFS